MWGGVIPDGATVTCGARLLLSKAIGSVQLSNAVELMPILARISEGHLINTGDVTSEGIYQWQKSLPWTLTRASLGFDIKRRKRRYFMGHNNNQAR